MLTVGDTDVECGCSPMVCSGYSSSELFPSTIGHLALSLVVIGSQGSCLSWLPQGTPVVVVVVVVRAGTQS